MITNKLLQPLLLLALVISAAAQQKKIPLVSDNSVPGSEGLKFNLPDDGKISFNMVRSGTGDLPSTVALSLSSFKGPQNEVLPVIVEANSCPAQPSCVAADSNGFFHVSLRASPAPSAGPYVRTLLIRAPGYQPLVLKITLTKNVLRPAVLTISRKDGTIVVTRSLCQEIPYWFGRDFKWCEFSSEPPWLSSEDLVLPVVQIQAALKQVHDLAQRYWLTGEDSLKSRLDDAEKMIKIWNSVRNLKAKVEKEQLPSFVVTRLRSRLSRTIAQIGQEVPSDAKAAQLQSQLDALVTWTLLSTRNKSCWDDVSASAGGLLTEIDPLAIPDPQRQIFTALRDGVANALQAGLPADPGLAPAAMAALDRELSKIQMLWPRRALGEFVTLANFLIQGGSDDAFLRMADDLAWQTVSPLPLKIKLPETNGPDPVEAFQPLKVSITTGDDAWDDSFFFATQTEVRMGVSTSK